MPLDLGNINPSGGEGATESPAEKTARTGSAVPSSRQWLRRVTVVVGDGKDALDVSELRIRFAVRQGDRQTPSNATVRIYNLSDATAQKIQKEFTKISVTVGYQDNTGLIFTGEIKQKRKGRENPIDTYVDILAVNADRAYNFAVVNKTLAAGHTYRDQVDEALKAFKPFGVAAGFIDDLGSRKMPRAKTMFGMARDVLRTVGFSTAASWSIQNDKFQMVKNSGTLPGDIIVLNSTTGLIGLPVQTIDGIIIRALINPKLTPGRRVKVDQKSIQQAQLNPAWTAEVANTMIPGIADDGIYKVLIVDHEGDTRGQEYYSDLTCIRADGQGPLPIGLANRGIILDPEAS